MDGASYNRMGKEFTLSHREGAGKADLTQNLLQKKMMQDNPRSSVMVLR